MNTQPAQRLECVVHDYAWGDTFTLADLVGFEPTGEPAAELWMGAHPRGASVLPDGRTLAEAIEADPIGQLGPEVDERFGQLPFLFKVLAIADALSIQVHPTLEQARAGFARENEAGVALDAANRTYRDPNHKPELIVALTPFEALCGFREPGTTGRFLGALGLADASDEVAARFVSLVDAGDIAATVTWVLTLGADDAATLVSGIVAGAGQMVEAESSGIIPEAEFSSTASTIHRLGTAAPDDPGVAVACLLNHIWLEPGEAVFLDAGNMHAYLNGVGVELMANSDNVVRGGLTPKNIDIPELCAVTRFVAEEPPIQRRDGDRQTYSSPVQEFDLTRIELSDAPVGIGRGPSIVLITDGQASFTMQDTTSDLERGQVLYVPHGGEHADAAGSSAEGFISGSGTAWVASVGRD